MKIIKNLDQSQLDHFLDLYQDYQNIDPDHFSHNYNSFCIIFANIDPDQYSHNYNTFVVFLQQFTMIVVSLQILIWINYDSMQSMV